MFLQINNHTFLSGPRQQHRKRQPLRGRPPQPDPRGGRPQRVLRALHERLPRVCRVRQPLRIVHLRLQSRIWRQVRVYICWMEIYKDEVNKHSLEAHAYFVNTAGSQIQAS